MEKSLEKDHHKKDCPHQGCIADGLRVDECFCLCAPAPSQPSLPQKEIEKWEKSFDEKYLDRPYEEGIVYATGKDLKDFIRTEKEISAREERDEIVRMLKKVEEKEHRQLGKHGCPYSDVIKEITSRNQQ